MYMYFKLDLLLNNSVLGDERTMSIIHEQGEKEATIISLTLSSCNQTQYH